MHLQAWFLRGIVDSDDITTDIGIATDLLWRGMSVCICMYVCQTRALC